MNERIKELAEQSGAWEYYEINEGVYGDEKPLEKFAELIVLACMTVVSSKCASQTAYKALADHFGVEE